MLTQLLRLLKSEDDRSVGHVVYWTGQILEDLMPGVFVGVYAPVVPNFFLKLAEIVADAMVSETISPFDWKSVTNKSVYTSHAKCFEITKVEDGQGWKKADFWFLLAFFFF